MESIKILPKVKKKKKIAVHGYKPKCQRNPRLEGSIQWHVCFLGRGAGSSMWAGVEWEWGNME